MSGVVFCVCQVRSQLVSVSADVFVRRLAFLLMGWVGLGGVVRPDGVSIAHVARARWNPG